MENSTDLLLYILLFVIAFVISVWITRAIYSIPAFLRYQRAQLKLIALMAHENGVDAKKINKIIQEAYGNNEKEKEEDKSSAVNALRQEQ